MSWDLTASTYLEPLLNRRAWEDTSTWRSSTLAHEVAASVRGQHTFGDRVAPQFQRVIGGLYTVRGYPESMVAGDSAIIGSVEYRFHVPRVFEPNPEPPELFGSPFRVAPQQVYGRPDWDLVFRTFFDVGRVTNADRLPFESDHTLMGTGLGVELQFKRNVSFRVDWGFALNEVETTSRRVTRGSSRVHIVATFLY